MNLSRISLSVQCLEIHLARSTFLIFGAEGVSADGITPTITLERDIFSRMLALRLIPA